MRDRKIEIGKKRDRKIDIERKREIEKGGNGGTCSLSFLLFELEGPKVLVFVWLCQDFLAEHAIRQENRGRVVSRHGENRFAAFVPVAFYVFSFFCFVC